MRTPEPKEEADFRREVRRLRAPFVRTLALTALLVVALAGLLFWTAAHSEVPGTLGVVGGLVAAAALGLLAFGGYRGWAEAQGLGEHFDAQMGQRQEQLDALRRRHFLLSATLSGVGDAVIIADIGGRITFLNPVAEKLTAWQEPDAVGREVKTVLSLMDEKTGATMADPAMAALSASVRLDFPPHAAQVARTGERRPVSGSGTPLWEEHGRPGGVALVFRDISERRGASETFLNMKAHRDSSEARAEAILETTLDGVVLMRQAGEIAGFNPAAERLFGWTSGQVIGRPAADLLFPASVRVDFRREASQAAEGPSVLPARAETTALRADGHTFPVEMTITSIPRQETPLFAIHLRDISDRRESEAALRRAQDAALAESRETSALLANMSDELRTPLNAVIGYSEMLQEEANDRRQTDLLPDLQKIHGAGKHLLSLINDILDLSKIEAGQMALYPETFDVAAMLEEVTKTVQPILTQNGNALRLRAAGDLGVMHTDRAKVKQSLLNLLSNAVGFSQERIVTLEASREHHPQGDWIVFRLADGGDQELPPHTPLPQEAAALPASGPPRFSGHGLALVVARRFCQMLGGEFTGSREPGRGAVYRLRFPAQ